MAKFRTDTQAVVNLVINGQQSQASLKQLTDTARKLRTEFNNMTEAADPAAYAKLRDELKKVNEVINDVKKSTKGAAEELTGFEKIAAGVFGGNILTRAWDLAQRGIVGFITKNAELSDQMAGVIKTTGLNEAAVDRLNEKFKDINKFDTRTARSELLALAQAAGKLGYSSEKDVEGFVRAADKIGVALGEDLGGTEEAVKSIGKLIDIFKINEDYSLEESIIKVGSAINELGANGTANEKYLIDFTSRLAGIAPAANISMTDVMGLGATLDELGQQVEASSTAIGQFIVGMGKDIPKFAKIAKMSVADFTALLRDDANEAFLRVLEASKNTGGGIQELARNMGILDVEGARALTAIGVLADNTDKLRAKQDLASKSFADGTSIVKEFDNVNNNLAANLEKIQNRLSALWENSGLRQRFTELTRWLITTESEFEKLTRAQDKQLDVLTDLEKEIVPLIDEYEKLYGKVDKNKVEHARLAEVIQGLGERYPIAITKMDEYGTALEINTAKVKQMIDAERLLSQQMNKSAIDAGKQSEEYLKKRIDRMKQIQQTGVGEMSQGQYYNPQHIFNNEELVKNNKNLAETEDRLRVVQLQLIKLGATDVQFTPTQAEMQETKRAERELAALKETYEVLNRKKESGIKLTKEEEEQIKKYLKAIGEYKEPPAPTIEPSKTKEQLKAEEKLRRQGISDAKRAAEEYKKLLKEYDALDAKRLIDQLSKNQKEQAQLAKTYDDEIVKYEEFLSKKGVTDEQRKAITDKIKDLEAQKDKAVKDLQIRQEVDYTNKINDLRTSLSNRHETELQKERDRINKHYDTLINENKDDEERVAALNKERDKDLADAKIREVERAEKEKAAIIADGERLDEFSDHKRILQINKRYDAEIVALKEKFSEEFQLTAEFHALMAELEKNRRAELKLVEKDYQRDIKNLGIDAAKEAAGAMFSIMANNRRAETDAAIAEINKQRDAELSNKNLTEAQKKQINAKYDAMEKSEKRKAWAAQKRADLAQAVINMALGITRALASSPPPANWINAAAVGAASTAQIAVIATQKAPQFAKGGLLPIGPTHASGGLQLINPQTRKQMAELEGGEPVLSRNTYANNREVVDKLLYSSMRRNGARVQINPELKEAALNGRSSGSAIPQPSPVVNVTAPAPDLSALNERFDVLITAFNNAQDKQVVLSMKNFEEEQTKIVALRTDNNA